MSWFTLCSINEGQEELGLSEDNGLEKDNSENSDKDHAQDIYFVVFGECFSIFHDKMNSCLSL